MAVDFNIKTYFTPSFSGGFGGTQGWKQPYELAALNLGSPSVDTIPKVHQYIYDQDFDSGLRAPVSRIEIVKTLTQGSYANVIIESRSDRDFFDIVDNEGTGHMMPRIKFPYRAWEINLKGKDDADFPATPMFRGMRIRVMASVIGDKKIDNVQDKVYRWVVELQSPERWNLRQDQGVSLWYHRKIRPPNSRHIAFDTSQHITFNTAMSDVAYWMNQGRPTVDFPFDFQPPDPLTAPYNAAPYTNYFDAITFSQIMTITANEQSSTWEILTDLLSYMGAVEGLGNKYLPVMDITGQISVVMGGFDKTQAAYDDFRTFASMQRFYYASQGSPYDPSNNLGNGVLCANDINQILVKFAITNTAEYWIQFKLWKWSGSAWTNVVTLPEVGYEYVPFESENTHNQKKFAFPAQPGGSYYTWTAAIVCSNGSFVLSGTDSGAYGVASHALLSSSSEIDTTQLRTFAMTRGLCRYINQLEAVTADQCPDFFAGQCPAQWGLYPDPITSTTVALTGNLTFTPASATVTGSGTAFLSELSAGDLIKHNYGDVYQLVGSVESNVSLTLTAGFYDPCYNLSPLVGASKKSGSSASNEVVNPTYGILSGQPLNFNNYSNTGVWNTKCRLVSKKMYNCALNTDSSIREPINVHLEFVDGWTDDLVGKYLEYYDPNLDEDIIFRCLQQTHIMQARRLNTTVDGFRI